MPEPVGALDSAVAYVRAVLRHWIALVGGTVPAVVAAIADAAGTPLPRWVWIAAMVAGFVVAQFLAFHDLRVQHLATLRDRRSQRVSDLPSRIQGTPAFVPPDEYVIAALHQLIAALPDHVPELDYLTIEGLLTRIDREGVDVRYEPLDPVAVLDMLDRRPDLVEPVGNGRYRVIKRGR